MRGRIAERTMAIAALAWVAVAGCSAVSGLSGYTFDASTGAGGGGAAGGHATTGGGSGGDQCAHASDCEGRDCIEVSCQSGRCVVSPAASGETCATGVCDGHGSCVACVSSSDCATVVECQTPTCVSRACSFTPVPARTPCGTGGAMVCDGKGACVACQGDDSCPVGTKCLGLNCVDQCNDGMKDLGETGPDCGGGVCPGCPGGTNCSNAADCSSNFCVDGICCDAACDESCVSCTRLGSLGTCTPVPQGLADDQCDGANGGCLVRPCACNGSGLCLQASGTACVSDNDCASGRCRPGPRLCQ